MNNKYIRERDLVEAYKTISHISMSLVSIIELLSVVYRKHLLNKTGTARERVQRFMQKVSNFRKCKPNLDTDSSQSRKKLLFMKRLILASFSSII